MKRIVLIAALLAATSCLADEQEIALKPGHGMETVQTNCNSCHSLDYIRTNAPFPNAKLWEAEVTKMIKVFGAPIEEKDAKDIVDYLAKNYGS